MKNMFKFWGIIAFAAVIVFSMIGCGEDNSGDNKSGDGGINFSDAKWSNIEVYNSDGSALYNGSNVTFTKVGYGTAKTFSEVSNNPSAWNVKIINNKLSVALGNPDKAAHSDMIPNSVNQDGLKVIVYAEFEDDNGNTLSLIDPDHNDGVKYIFFAYADKTGIISGSADPVNFNLNLKAGWNTVIYTAVPLVSATFTTGAPGSNFKWVYSGD